FAGIVGLGVGFPLDTVKVRFQDPSTAVRYRHGTFNAVAKIIREERVFGLYKGITSPLAGCAFLNGVVFWGYGFLMRVQLEKESDEPTLMQVALAGAGSGVMASFVTCPTELIKIRQQALITSQPTAREVAAKLIRSQGLRGLYQGVTITALRDTGYGAYFATYEGLCRLLRPSRDPEHSHSSLAAEADSALQELSWPRLMFAGGVAGIMGWVSTFPLDLVKTRIQGNERSPGNPYNRIWSTIIHSFRRDGIDVFWVGLAPTLIRAIPVNMATFAAFEFVKTLF
ncbi:hypothetical protein M422DRAFT_151609, partial [Sphaerobolus stellatus SS14]